MPSGAYLRVSLQGLDDEDKKFLIDVSKIAYERLCISGTRRSAAV